MFLEGPVILLPCMKLQNVSLLLRVFSGEHCRWVVVDILCLCFSPFSSVCITELMEINRGKVDFTDNFTYSYSKSLNLSVIFGVAFYSAFFDGHRQLIQCTVHKS